jgi:integrase
VDLEAGTLRLDPGQTKNDEARVVYLTPEVKGLLAAQVVRVEALQRRLGRIVPFLFPRTGKGKRAGQRRGDFRKAWAAACRAAGVPGMHRHDLRRTAVRNLVNAGVPERVAMKITGHKTRAVFDRYHIVAPGDLQEAARKLAGTFSGTLIPGAVDSSLQASDIPTIGG